MSFFDGLDAVVGFVHNKVCDSTPAPQPLLTLPTSPMQVNNAAQHVISANGTAAATAQTPTAAPAVPKQPRPPVQQAAPTTTGSTLRRRKQTPATSTATQTPPTAAPASRSWLSMTGSLVKGTVLLPFKVLYHTAALTASVANAVYKNSTFSTVASPALGYLAANYAPATVQLAAASIGTLTGYTPPTGVVASAAGSLAAYTISKTVPAVYRSATGYVAEKMRALPPALARTGLNKGDISLELATKIAKLPAANQTSLGQALVTLRDGGILNPANSAALLAAKYPLATARAMVQLQPAYALKDCIEIFKHSENPESLAQIFTLLLSAGYDIKPFTALPTSIFASASAQQLTKLAQALTVLNQEAGRLKAIVDLVGLNLLESDEPQLIGAGLIALRNGGLTDDHATFAPLFTALEKAPADSLQKIVPALQAVLRQPTPPAAASALITSQSPIALAKIFLTLRAANLYLSPLLQKKNLCDPKQATAPQLEIVASALDKLQANSSASEFELFIKEVLDSDAPAALANSIVLLQQNGLMTRERFATLVQYTDEASQIITLLDNEGMLTDRIYTAIMKEKNPLAAAKKQTDARAKLREQQTLAQGILTAAAISSPSTIAAVNASQDPQRLARALVKLKTLGILKATSIAEMVRLDTIFPGADTLNQLANEMVGRF